MQEQESKGVTTYPADRASVGYGPMIGYITGDLASKDVWFDGSLLANKEEEPFGWGDESHASHHLALNILMELESRNVVNRHFVLTLHRPFLNQMIANLPQSNFALAISDVKDWIVAAMPEVK